jgi:nucleoside transporter
MATTEPSNLKLRLSIMMFLQFFIWGSWAPTLGNYMGTIQMADSINWAYSLGPIAAIITPFFMGMVADRFFDSEKVLAILCIIGGVAMCLMPQFAGSSMFLTLLGIHALCYLPTLGITASLSFHHLKNQEKDFPVVRVFGTIGWIVAGVLIGKILQADSSPIPLYLGGAASVLLGIYSFSLPQTPPPLSGKQSSWKEIAGFGALSQLKDRSFIVFLVSAMLIFIAFGTYFPYAPVYFSNLNQTLSLEHFTNPSFEMSFGQFSEIFFMLMIPFLFHRLGVKWMLFLGMLAWLARFTLFASASMSGSFWLIMLGIAIHGICYDFFFVTGQIYIDKETSPEIRGQVQGLLVLLTQGVGFLLGTQLSGAFFNGHATDGMMALADWKSFWTIFAIATAIFAVIFFLLFKEKTDYREANV